MQNESGPPPLVVPTVFLFAYMQVPKAVGREGRVVFVRTIQEVMQVWPSPVHWCLVIMTSGKPEVTFGTLNESRNVISAGFAILERCQGHTAIQTPSPNLWHTLFHWVKVTQPTRPTIPVLTNLTDALCGPAILSLRDREDFDPEKALQLCGVYELLSSLKNACVPDQVNAWCTLAKHLVL